MFTGIITDLGEITSIQPTAQGQLHRLRIACRYDQKTIADGASIACNGVCLTATSIKPLASGSEFSVDVSNETLAKSTLSEWATGSRVNLERSLKAGDELGGHIVSGHVDGVAKIVSITQDGASKRFLFEAPEHLSRYIAPKGSVALDGTSLTVSGLGADPDDYFEVSLIPTTLELTTLGRAPVGTVVNLEVDVIAKYVERLVTKTTE